MSSDKNPAVEVAATTENVGAGEFGAQLITVILPALDYMHPESHDQEYVRLREILDSYSPVDVDRDLVNSWRNGNVIPTPWGGRVVNNEGRKIREFEKARYCVSLASLISEFGSSPVYIIYKQEEGQAKKLEIRPGIPQEGTKVLKPQVMNEVLDVLAGWMVPVLHCFINPRDNGMELCNLIVRAQPLGTKQRDQCTMADINYVYRDGRMWVRMPYERARNLNESGGRAAVKEILASKA
ncbi:MAG: hypothetical protein Q7S37_05285 [bacterium]|nr:hypothetical protein [bacterium]